MLTLLIDDLFFCSNLQVVFVFLKFNSKFGFSVFTARSSMKNIGKTKTQPATKNTAYTSVKLFHVN